MKKLVLLSVVLLAVSAVAENNISLPAGTSMKVKLENALTTFSSKSGDPFSARVTEAVMLAQADHHPAQGATGSRLQ